MTLAAKPFAPYRALPEGQRVCGPTFAGSSDLGGADADFIGGTLIDCKATTQPRQPARTSCTSSPDLDRRGTKELTGRVGELQAEVQRVKDELAAVRADNARLRRELEEAQDEVVAVREAGRQMFKNVNRSG